MAPGVLVTPDDHADSVFQIGSITRVWTATLVRQLLEVGTVDLDVPVRTYPPELGIPDESAAVRITTRRRRGRRARRPAWVAL
jgi:CubicO group peptidase (beta-lactamase class C family)